MFGPSFYFKKESTILCLLHSRDIHLEKSQAKVHPLNVVEVVAAKKRRWFFWREKNRRLFPAEIERLG